MNKNVFIEPYRDLLRKTTDLTYKQLQYIEINAVEVKLNRYEVTPQVYSMGVYNNYYFQDIYGDIIVIIGIDKVTDEIVLHKMSKELKEIGESYE